jgi:hypothetical protein
MNLIQKLAVKELSKLYTNMYQVGGSLLPHETRDYDFLVYSPDRVGDILAFWGSNYTEYGASEVRCYEAYGVEDGGKKCVIKLMIADQWFDLMYVADPYQVLSVNGYMEYFFPLSCQCIAKDMGTGVLSNEPDVDDIKFWCNLDNAALLKYLDYYPQATFTKIDRR